MSAGVAVVPARLDWLEALIEGDEVFTERFGIAVVDGWVGFPEALVKARDAALIQDQNPWGTHLFFDDADGALVGWGGWKGAPVEGEAELGYSIAPARQGRGLATAAVAALLARAGETDLLWATAQTLGAKSASTAVLEKNGFIRGIDAVDPDHGTLWSWGHPMKGRRSY